MKVKITSFFLSILFFVSCSSTKSQEQLDFQAICKLGESFNWAKYKGNDSWLAESFTREFYQEIKTTSVATIFKAIDGTAPSQKWSFVEMGAKELNVKITNCKKFKTYMLGDYDSLINN